MFPRVTNPSAAPVPTEVVRALDLHVLGVPPAFVLSQDQTLKLKCDYSHVLDVRTSAHLNRLPKQPFLITCLTETGNGHFLSSVSELPK